MFQNGISQNTKCAERDGFRREGHICCSVLKQNLASYVAIYTNFYRKKSFGQEKFGESLAIHQSRQNFLPPKFCIIW